MNLETFYVKRDNFFFAVGEVVPAKTRTRVQRGRSRLRQFLKKENEITGEI